MMRLLLLLVLLCPSFAHAVTYWQSDFDAADSNWSNGIESSIALNSGSIQVQTAQKHAGAGAVAYVYDYPVTGACLHQSVNFIDCGGFYDRTFPETDTLFTKFWVRLTPGFIVDETVTKIWKSGGPNHSNWTTMLFGSSTLAYTLQDSPTVGASTNLFASAGLDTVNGTWACIEQEETQNTPGVANGIIRIWKDGTLILQKTDAIIRLAGNTRGFNYSRLFRQYGGATGGSGRLYIDEFAVGNTRIGCGASAPPPADTIAPTVPSSPSSTSITGQVSLSWTASSDNVGVTSYTVRYCTGAACTPSIVGATVNGSTTSATITGLTAGTVIGMNVFASDLAGNQSASSTTVYQTVAAASSSSSSLTINSSGLFVLNGVQTFLLQISYFDGLDYRTSDIDYFATHGYNSLRVFTVWEGLDASSVCNASGAINNTQATTMQALIDYAKTKNMVVELVILDDNSDTLMTTQTPRATCVTNVVNQFKSNWNVIFDVINEYNFTFDASGTHSASEYQVYYTAARTACPLCIFYSSGGPPKSSPEDSTASIITTELDAVLATGVNGLAIHDYRSTNWFSVTGARVTAYRNYLVSKGRPEMPVIFNEPNRRGSPWIDSSEAEFLQAAVGAKNAGAALWTHHTQACFQMSAASCVSQLDSVELAITLSISSALSDTSSAGTPTSLATDTFNRTDSSSLGANWTTGYTGTDSIQIVGNRIRAQTTASESVSQYTGTSTPANHGATISVATLGAGAMYGRISVRMADPATYSGYDCRMNFNPDTVSIVRKDAGSPVTIAGPVSATLSAGDTIGCFANGNTIYMTQGAVDSTPLLSVVDSTYLSGTTSLYMNTSGNPLADLEFDSYTLYEFVTASTPGVINHDTTAVSAAGSAVTTRTVAAVVSTASDRELVCGTGARGNSAANLVVSGMTFGGVPMLKLREDISGDIGGGEFTGTSLWGLVAPTVSSANAVATWTGSISNIATAWCTSLNGVNQTTPIGPVGGSTNNSGTTNITTSVTPLVANAWLIDSVYSGDDTGNTVGAGQISRSSRTVTGGSTDAVSVSTEGPIVTPAATAMSWTPSLGATFYAQSVVTINPTDPVTICTPSITSVTPGATTATVGWDAACPPTSIRVANDFGSSIQALSAFPSGVYTPVGGWPNGMTFACFFAIDSQGTEPTEQTCGNWVGVLITDTTPPVMTTVFPTISLPAGTTSTNYVLTTDEPAVCRSATTNIAYGSMTTTLVTSSLSHTGNVTGLTDGSTTTIYNQCADLVTGVNNTTTTPLIVTITVANSTADTTPPTTVANLVASALSSTQVRLTHSAATDAGGAVTYQAFLSTDASTYTIVSNYSGTTTDVLNLQPNTLYYFKVIAFDPSLNPSAAYSNVASVTTPATPDTFAPTGVTSLAVTAAFQSSHVLQWVQGVDGQGPTTTTIESCTEVSPPTACTNFSVVKSQITGTILQPSLTPSTTYCYRAMAVDQAGNRASGYSNVVCAATLASSPHSLTRPRLNLRFGTTRLPRS